MSTRKDDTNDELLDKLRSILGLNLYEARAYLALLRGAKDYKTVSSLGRVPMPRVYDVIKSLESKGIVLKNGGFYRPVGVEVAASMVALKLKLEAYKRAEAIIEAGKALANTIAETIKLGRPGESEGRVELLEGFESILARFSEELVSASKVYLVVKKAAKFRDLFLLQIESLPKRPKTLRAIVQASVDLDKESLNRAREAGLELRTVEYVPYDTLVSDSGTIIIGFPDPLSQLDRRPVALVVKSFRMAKAAIKELDKEWESLKKQL